MIIKKTKGKLRNNKPSEANPSEANNNRVKPIITE